MKYVCGKCGSELVDGEAVCKNCGTRNKIPEVSGIAAETTTSAPKVNVQNGRYIGKKWFIKLAYKTFETDVEFFDEHMVLSQGTGFASISYKTPTQIQYKSVYGVDVKNQYSIPNVIFAIIVAILAVAMQVWVALLIAAVVLFLGKTAVATINHSGGQYVVPTEFLSDAEELRNKINMAINQSRG